jgi:hypothetical protein
MRMKVWELIEQLKKMPQHAVVKTEAGDYLEDPDFVEQDSRDYVIIRSK